MLDFFSQEYKVGDYVFCAVHARCSSVDTYVGKVVKINNKTISVANFNGWSWRDNGMAISVLQVPERHMIISEELALQREPRLKDL